eukprot:gene8837-biopygen18161
MRSYPPRRGCRLCGRDLAEFWRLRRTNAFIQSRGFRQANDSDLRLCPGRLRHSFSWPQSGRVCALSRALPAAAGPPAGRPPTGRPARLAGGRSWPESASRWRLADRPRMISATSLPRILAPPAVCPQSAWEEVGCYPPSTPPRAGGAVADLGGGDHSLEVGHRGVCARARMCLAQSVGAGELVCCGV